MNAHRLERSRQWCADLNKKHLGDLIGVVGELLQRCCGTAIFCLIPECGKNCRVLGRERRGKKSGDDNGDMTIKLVVGERVRLIMPESLVLYIVPSAISELEAREIEPVYPVTSVAGKETTVYVQYVYSTLYSN